MRVVVPVLVEVRLAGKGHGAVRSQRCQRAERFGDDEKIVVIGHPKVGGGIDEGLRPAAHRHQRRSMLIPQPAADFVDGQTEVRARQLHAIQLGTSTACTTEASECPRCSC